jgi:hypothetical protein
MTAFAAKNSIVRAAVHLCKEMPLWNPSLHTAALLLLRTCKYLSESLVTTTAAILKSDNAQCYTRASQTCA